MPLLITVHGKGKGKAPCTGFLQAHTVPEVWGAQISRQLVHKGGKVISPKYRSPLPPGHIPGNHFCQKLNRPQGGLKDYVNEKFQWHIRESNPLVEQCLNQLRHCVPPSRPWDRPNLLLAAACRAVSHTSPTLVQNTALRQCKLRTDTHTLSFRINATPIKQEKQYT